MMKITNVLQTATVAAVVLSLGWGQAVMAFSAGITELVVLPMMDLKWWLCDPPSPPMAVSLRLILKPNLVGGYE
jgi:hypothetical protein